MTDEQLSALLRLKRHETPPPGYFDRLLVDVQRRQRAELLRRPLWKIALERFQTFFGEHSMSSVSYAGAVASLVITGLLAASAWRSEINPAGGRAAVAQLAAPAGERVGLTESTTTPPRALALRMPDKPAESRWQAARFTAPQPYLGPRYVMESRPAVYEPPHSF